MRWFGRRDNAETGQVRPAELKVPFDAGVLDGKFERLIDHMDEAGGIERYTEALTGKQALFEQVLSAASEGVPTQDEWIALFETVFTARRKFAGPFLGLTGEQRQALVGALLDKRGDPLDRIGDFAAGAPTGGDRKIRRAAWDFAAECLHFHDPEQCPLMTRWVWDAATESGALRELIRGSDGLREVPLGDTSGTYEAARLWIADQLAERGYYRAVAFVIDLVLAQAYSDYMQAMSFNAGMVTGELGAKADPLEFVVKLLGIDAARRGGRSRVRKGPTRH
jgi:hypothetical protein